METDAQIAERWIYLRNLLREQLARFRGGTLQIHAGGDDVSSAAIARLMREIADFDTLISRNDRRAAQDKS